MRRILLIVTIFFLAFVAFMGCHKDPLDYGNVGVLNLNLQRGYKTINKEALESFDARVTIYYSTDDTVSYNCRFIDTDGDGLYNNDPTALDNLYVRREVGFWVGVWAVIQGDTVTGMSDPTNLLYLSEENPLIDVYIVLISGYPRIVLNANPMFDGESFMLHGEVLEGIEQIEQFGFLMRPGQLSDEEKRIWSKRVLTRLDLEELFASDYYGIEGMPVDNDANKFVGQVDMGELSGDEYSVVAFAMLRMNDNDTIEKIIHSSFATMKFSLDGVYIDEPYYNGDTVTLYAYYAGSAQVNECGFVLGFSDNELTDTMLCQQTQTDAVFSLSLSTIQPNTTYYYTAYVKTVDGLIESEIGQFRLTKEPSAPTGYMDGYGYVDLGLPSGTLWAYTNIGASVPEEYGNYYAWGETETKETYDWSTYRYCNGSETTLTKYCSDESYGNEGYTDTLTTLEASDDAATVNWGAVWRMPTISERSELENNSTVTWTTQNGINGCLFTGPNGNSIFLPAAGYRIDSSLYDVGSYGIYWSSSLFTGFPSGAWDLYFNSDGYYVNYGDLRYYGRSVRPVCVSSQK